MNTEIHPIPTAPHMNALKHGLRSETTLLPGDNPAAFRIHREQLFHLYQPLTVDEAFCVEQMAKLQWRIERCDRWQEVYDAQQDALLAGDPGLDGALCEPDAHRSLHRPMDCELHAGRMDRRLNRARARLFELQKLRRLNLIPGKEYVAADYRVFLGTTEETAATHSDDRVNRKPSERTGATVHIPLPPAGENPLRSRDWAATADWLVTSWGAQVMPAR